MSATEDTPASLVAAPEEIQTNLHALLEEILHSTTKLTSIILAQGRRVGKYRVVANEG